MDRCREKTTRFITRLAHGLGKKQRPPGPIVPLSRSLGSPAAQTSFSTSSRIGYLDWMLRVDLPHSIFLVFELPDELILSVLSHISPDPPVIGHYARFRLQYCMQISDCHQQRARFLLSLSMTCRAMRLRLLPWIWERIECFKSVPRCGPEGFPKGLNAMVGALHTDIFLAVSVKYSCALLCMYTNQS